MAEKLKFVFGKCRPQVGKKEKMLITRLSYWVVKSMDCVVPRGLNRQLTVNLSIKNYLPILVTSNNSYPVPILSDNM